VKKYVCTVCGYVYDEAAGIPDSGIAPGTKWEDIPEDWTCPLCGATKAEFKEQKVEEKPVVKKISVQETYEEDMRELSCGELSALCSNLSKGCEKQYRTEEAGLFAQLAEYYKGKSKPANASQFEVLSDLIHKDLECYANANSISAVQADRGALRALVWGEKVTRILSSLLSRYEKQKNTLLENTNVYVCEICGFIYIGNEPPEICPVCKVPSMKIRKIEKEAV
jgi:rubredoxin